MQKIVILDNGHGVDTPGKRSPMWHNGTQLLEYEFNRDIVSRIIYKLKKMCIPYINLVPEQEDISLKERVRRVNEIYRKHKGAYLVSVHGNAGGGRGFEVFTSTGQTLTDKYAEFFIDEFSSLIIGQPIRTDLIDGDRDKEADFYVLKYTQCPALLTENLFYDNEENCRIMLSSSGRNLIASAHVKAIDKIYNL